MRDWGDLNLSPQQNRIWRKLVAARECKIGSLFVAARPTSSTTDIPPPQQHRVVGAAISRINDRLRDSCYAVRPGESRFTYAIDPPVL